MPAIDFKKYKEVVNNNKYELNIKLDNLKTIKKKIHCEMKEEDIKKADNFNKKYTNLSEIYQKIEKALSYIIEDFQILEGHMKEVSNQFILLSSELYDDQSAAKLRDIFCQLSKLFSQWSVSYSNQYKFFKENFSIKYKFMSLEAQELSQIYKSYINYKDEYVDFAMKINKRKEDLFEQKDYKNWSLAPGTESQLPSFQNNKKVAFEKMLYKETYLLTQAKRRLACAIHFLFKQYNKMIKHQTEEMEDYFNNLKEKNKIVLGDAVNLIKIFSIITKKKENEKENENKKENGKIEKENN